MISSRALEDPASEDFLFTYPEFKEYYASLMHIHDRCGEDCVHLQRWHKKMGKRGLSRHLPAEVHRQEVHGHPQAGHRPPPQVQAPAQEQPRQTRAALLQVLLTNLINRLIIVVVGSSRLFVLPADGEYLEEVGQASSGRLGRQLVVVHDLVAVVLQVVRVVQADRERVVRALSLTNTYRDAGDLLICEVAEVVGAVWTPFDQEFRVYVR